MPLRRQSSRMRRQLYENQLEHNRELYQVGKLKTNMIWSGISLVYFTFCLLCPTIFNKPLNPMCEARMELTVAICGVGFGAALFLIYLV